MELLQAAIDLLTDANFLEDRLEFARRSSLLASRVQTLLDTAPNLTDEAQAKARTFILTITQLTDASNHPLKIRQGQQAEASINALLQEAMLLKEQLEAKIHSPLVRGQKQRQYEHAKDLLTKLGAAIECFQIAHQEAKTNGECWLPTEENNSDHDAFLGIKTCVNALNEYELKDQDLEKFTKEAQSRLENVGVEQERTIVMRQKIRIITGRSNDDLESSSPSPTKG